jgi:hypothetical protein
MHGAQCVMKPRVVRPRIHQIRKAQLRNAPQSLKIGMFNQVENQLARQGDKTVNGVVKDFSFW